MGRRSLNALLKIYDFLERVSKDSSVNVEAPMIEDLLKISYIKRGLLEIEDLSEVV